MPIRFACSCGKKFKAIDEHAGKRTRCPACGHSLTIPMAVEPGPPIPEELPEAPPVRAVIPVPAGSPAAAVPPPRAAVAALPAAVPIYSAPAAPVAPPPAAIPIWGTPPPVVPAHTPAIPIYPVDAASAPFAPVAAPAEMGSPFAPFVPASSAGPGSAWPAGVRAVSGPGPFGEYEMAFVVTPTEFMLVHGRQTSVHPVVVIISTLITTLMCTPAGVVMLLVIPFDLTIFRKKRERVWQRFLAYDLASLRAQPSYCKVYPLNRLISISFNEANQKLYARISRGIGSLRIKIKCPPGRHAEFRAFAAHCRSISGAAN